MTIRVYSGAEAGRYIHRELESAERLGLSGKAALAHVIRPGNLAAKFGVHRVALAGINQVSLAEQIGIRFKTLPAGKFKFQGADGVAFKGCQIAATELTNRMFEKLGELEPDKLAAIVTEPQARLGQSLSAVDPRHKDEAEDCPMVYLSAEEFDAIGRLLGIRLPNELEWERAAAGTGGRIYSFGDEFDPNKATFHGKGTRSVYLHRDAATPEGVLDLSGNVWEWGLNPYGKIDLSDRNSPKLPESGANRALRGCSWVNTDQDVLQAAYRSHGHPRSKCSVVGGRFAKDL